MSGANTPPDRRSAPETLDPINLATYAAHEFMDARQPSGDRATTELETNVAMFAMFWLASRADAGHRYTRELQRRIAAMAEGGASG
jgi:hypothetical protein